MSAIITKYVTEHKLNKEMSLEELRPHGPVLLKLLTDGTKRDKGRWRLRDGYVFSKEQISILIPSQRTGRVKSQVISQEEKLEARAEVNICQVSNLILQEESIGKLAERIVQENIGEKEVKAIRRALVETATDAVAGSSRISRLQRELRDLNAPEKIITAVLNRETTCASNKIQKERRQLRKDEGIHFPDEFSFESVKERLDDYDVSGEPNELALADVMIMLCIRPAELRTLRIANGKVTGYVKNRGQEDISRVFRSMGKDEERARQLLT